MISRDDPGQRGATVGTLQPPKVFLETFGCQMNFLDSELVRGRLAERRYVFTADRGDADVIAFNTCAVRDHAEGACGSTNCAGQGAPAGARRRGAQLHGAARGGAAARRFPHVDILCGTRGSGIHELVDRVRDGGGPIVALGGTEPTGARDSQRPHRHSAYVTIQRGCDRLHVLRRPAHADRGRASMDEFRGRGA
jgi:tRNA-2-methylthio-N6-dimethylallyladenosine synthase